MSLHRTSAPARNAGPGVLTRRRFLQMIGATAGGGAVASAMGASALMMAPLAAITFPSEVPGLDTFGSLLALGVGGTGIAFLLFYTLIAEVGPTRSSLVAYVAPGFSVLYGVFLLDESFTAATFAGLVLILGGSWLAAEARLPWQPKRAVAVAAPPTPEAAR